MYARSLEILNRTVMIPTDPRHTQEEVDQLIHNIDAVVRATFGQADPRDPSVAR